MVGPVEPGKGGDVGGTNEGRALAGVEKLAVVGFQQHYRLLALKHLYHFHQHFLCLVAKQEDQTGQSLPSLRWTGNLRTEVSVSHGTLLPQTRAPLHVKSRSFSP